MIEIEKKFLLTQQQIDALTENANELGEKLVEDSYLDTADYRLTLNDLWFRIRDGQYELKAPLTSSSDSVITTNRYHEITDTAKIAELLNLNTEIDFEQALEEAGITPFITCYTQRKSYEKQGFHLDIDTATYKDSDFTYAISEIELLVEDESVANEAERQIIEFARGYGFTLDQVIYGKIVAYLQVESPQHYQALLDGGVLR